MSKKNTAFIFARKGSKGLKNKNLCMFNDIPLIATSIKCALSSKRISRVIVSTDSGKIAKVAKSYGAEVPFMRPKELSMDNSPEWEAWKHAIRWAQNNGNLEKFISLPCTSPLKNKKDIDCCIEAYDKKKPDFVITVSESKRSPYFNMVRKKKNGRFELIDNKNLYFRRQDIPQIFDVTTVAYIARPDFILNNQSIFSGEVVAVKIPKGRSIDIDDIHDLEIAKMYYKNKMTKGDPEIL
tara:strand:+ start:30648 stop:31364 length:717 start_codon:yes stop_codon:yes gene_type:complete